MKLVKQVEVDKVWYEAKKPAAKTESNPYLDVMIFAMFAVTFVMVLIAIGMDSYKHEMREDTSTWVRGLSTSPSAP